MSGLRLAIERALERRQAHTMGPPAPSNHNNSDLAPSLPAAPLDGNSKKPRNIVLELEELYKVPGRQSQQLHALRCHFESCITQPSRYVDQQQLSRWTRGARCTDRSYGIGPRSLAKWNKDLESDIRSVVIEAGLSANASTAVVEAAKKGAIADNPGVLLCQIMALQSALDPYIGRRAVLSILNVMPSILNTSSDTIAWHFEELVTMLGPEATSLGVKAPFILIMAPFMLWSKLVYLQDLLGVTNDRAQGIVFRQPRLLAMAQTSLKNRMKELQFMTKLNDRSLRQLVAKQPSLLSYTTATLANNLVALGRCLGISTEQTSKMLTRVPTLSMLSPSTVVTKMAAIKSILDCTPNQASAMVTRQPSILCMSTELLAQKHEQVGLALHTSPQETSHVVRTYPSLLTLSKGTLAHKLRMLRGAVLEAQAAESTHVHCSTPAAAQQQRPQYSTPAPSPIMVRSSHAGLPRSSSLQHLSQNASSTSTTALNTLSSQSPTMNSAAGHVGHHTSEGPALYPPSASSHGSTNTATDTSIPTATQNCSTASTDTLNSSGAGVSMADSWLQQLDTHTPQLRAALACFSEKRFLRLPELAAARAGAQARRLSRQQQQQALQEHGRMQQQEPQTTEGCAQQGDMPACVEGGEHNSGVDLQRVLGHAALCCSLRAIEHGISMQAGGSIQPHEQEAAGAGVHQGVGSLHVSKASKQAGVRAGDTNGVPRTTTTKAKRRVSKAAHSLSAVLRMTDERYQAALASEQLL